MAEDIDKLFEKMSRECANKMNGTHPPKPKKTSGRRSSAKTTARKTSKKK